MSTTILDTLSATIIKLFREEFGTGKETGFRTYWDGDPGAIMASQLPALIVDWTVLEPSGKNPTGADRWQHTMVIKVVLNKMDDKGVLEKKGDGILIETPTKKRLEKYIIGRDAETGDYLPKTIYGILRRHFSMNGREITQALRLEFGVSRRPSANNKDVVTSEAHITMQANQTIVVDDKR